MKMTNSGMKMTNNGMTMDNNGIPIANHGMRMDNNGMEMDNNGDVNTKGKKDNIGVMIFNCHFWPFGCPRLISLPAFLFCWVTNIIS